MKSIRRVYNVPQADASVEVSIIPHVPTPQEIGAGIVDGFKTAGKPWFQANPWSGSGKINRPWTQIVKEKILGDLAKKYGFKPRITDKQNLTTELLLDMHWLYSDSPASPTPVGIESEMSNGNVFEEEIPKLINSQIDLGVLIQGISSTPSFRLLAEKFFTMVKDHHRLSEQYRPGFVFPGKKYAYVALHVDRRGSRDLVVSAADISHTREGPNVFEDVRIPRY